MKIFNESGKGYWMEGFGCIRAEGENRPSRPGHIVLGVDSYNLCLTGEIGRTLATPSGGLNEHIPVIVGCDVYNFQITGDVAANLNAASGCSANHSGPSVLIKANEDE